MSLCQSNFSPTRMTRFHFQLASRRRSRSHLSSPNRSARHQGQRQRSRNPAIFSGMLDIKSADPVEGMLVSQIVVAHEAALSMYQRAWSQPPEYFEARCRYLQLADKAQRTVALLTERLDRHRNSGLQQITVRPPPIMTSAPAAFLGSQGRTAGSC
jgi:hypothetical protein